MKKDINKEEEKIRAALKGKDFFTVPSGYFEELPGKISDQIKALPDFDKSAEANPFEVPADYFEKLPNEISGKIVSRKSKLETWLANIQRPRIAIPIAFATIIFLAGLFFLKQKTIVQPEAQELTIDDIKNSNYLLGIDEEIFVDVFAGQTDATSDESLEQYLIDNNIDLTQIENKL